MPIRNFASGLLLVLILGLPWGSTSSGQDGISPSTAPLTDKELKPRTLYQVRPGKPHPDFILPRIDDGQPLRLSDLRGKKVLLIHFASW